jgi:hypothetical protein
MAHNDTMVIFGKLVEQVACAIRRVIVDKQQATIWNGIKYSLANCSYIFRFIVSWDCN